MTANRLRTRKTSLALAALLALGVAPIDDSHAAACSFNPASGNWNVAANWNCGFVPGSSDTAVIAAGRSATVTGAQATTSVDNSGTVTLSNNSSVGLTGSNTNNGVISMQSAGNVTDLSISGLVSLGGTGSVQMSNATANRILGNAATLTVGAGQSILGSGQIGAGGSLALVNNGTFSATQVAPLTLHTTAGVTNNNLLRGDGGTLVLHSTSITQGALGRLDAVNGGTVQLSNASITGGSFTTSGSAAIATASGTTSSLSGVTNTGTFNVVNNSFVNLDGSLTNTGTFNLQSAGNATDLVITGARTITGSGVINLSNTQANRIHGSGGTLTLGSAQTLQGAGTIGAAAAGFGFVNQGTVIASQSAGLLINAAAGVTNTGALRADGGTLQLQTTVNSGGGSIEARNGSQVQLLNGAVINNANFSATGAGSLITTVGGGALITLGGGTVSGPMTIANNSFVRQTGNLVYNGTLNMASAGNATDLRIDGVRSITGTATINLSNTQQNRFVAANGAGDLLTLGNNVTVTGAGQLGAGTALALVNNGSIVASQSAGLLVETSAGLANNGVMRADGGPLQFRNVVVNSGSGTIEAVNGAQVQLFNGTVINNANFAASTGGVITTVGGGDTVTLGGGTVSGPMTVANNSFLRLTGDMTYNGVLSLASAGNNTDIQFSGARTLGGTATIALSNTQANRLVAVNATGDSAIIGSNISVQGAGSIGAGSALAVVNHGSLIANSNSGMVLSTTAGATNHALIRGDAASFTIANTQLSQGASGVLNAINGGSVLLANGSLVTGGSFSTASGGQIAVAGTNTARIAGVTNAGTLNIHNNGVLELGGTLTNNGSVNLLSAGNLTDLRAAGNQSILGTGTITLSNTTANRIHGASAGDSLTLGAGQTLQGAGQIGAGTQFNFTNHGTMLGNASNPLTFHSTGTMFNNGLVRADGGNVLVTGGTAFAQSGIGGLSAINGGIVTLNGNAVVSGGTLGTADAGQITTSGGGQTATVAHLANTGTFNVVNNSNLRLQGVVTNTGTLNMRSAGNATDLVISGAVNLAGNGITDLSNTTQNRVVAEAAGAQLTLGAGQTLRGSGQFGAGSALALVNLGTMSANQATPLTIAMTGPVSNAAGGTMQAVAGGTLNVDSALANAGTLAANGGVVNANAAFNGTGTALISGFGQLNVGATSTVGTLTHNGSAVNGLALGANSITVSADYTNVQAGAGNAFNRRAGVTGSGQILAGGNAAQVISGAAISGGNTANATLTIGNVHVGANTYGYTIGNGGSSGPTLRGAVQTSVNGANLTDARLSGTGISAGNYNAGAPAGAGEGRTVVFTAANAGNLAPMSGQVLNLRSNFDNIGDQKLAIVLGAGAAAYHLAAGSTAPSATVANQRVGGSQTVGLSVANIAPSGAFTEDMTTTVGVISGPVTASGAVNNLLAGASSGGINVGVATGTAGFKTGTVNLAYTSTGAVAGVSNGLGSTAVGGQPVTVSGNVYQAASGQLQGNALNFGTLQVGQQISQNLVVRNTASGPAGFVEDLNASFGVAGNGQISGSGSFAGITAGSNSTAANGTMTVTVSGSTAGALNSGIAVNYFSAGTVGGVGNGLGVLGVGSENFAVNGSISAVANVINQASPLVHTPSIQLGAVRVGAASPTATVSVSNQATTAPQAALNASITSNGAPVTASGSFNLLTPGATSTALQVGLNTAVAGNFTGANAGSATVGFVSDAGNVGNCAPNCQLSLAPQTVTVSGKVYAAAVGQLGTPVVDFGIVRVGDTVSAKNITVNNTAAAAALNDTLRASLTGVAGPFTPGAAAAGIAAQGSGQIAVGLNTAAAGVYTQNAAVGFLSQNADMADISAGPDAAVQVKAQVNHLANADFDLLAGLGTLSDDGQGHYTLDLGLFDLGDSGLWTLQIDNQVAGPADLLRGLFDLAGVDDFSLGGWSPVSDLAAGQAKGGLSIGFVASQLGLFEDEVLFAGFSFNASDAGGLAQLRSLRIRARVVDDGGNQVPEPGTLALLALALVLGRQASRRPRAG